MREPIGPNVKKLWLELAAAEAIPANAPNGLAAGINAILGLKNRGDNFLTRARVKLEAVLAAVKAAPDNRWGDDEEAIAGAILEQVAAKKAQQRAALAAGQRKEPRT